MHHKLYTQGSEMFPLSLRQRRYFKIARHDEVFVGSTRVIFTIHVGTRVTSRCFIASQSLIRTLLSYRDICQHGFHSETYADKKEKYILFTICNGYGKHILCVSSGLYYTYDTTRSTCCVRDSFPECLVHDKLGILVLVIQTLG